MTGVQTCALPISDADNVVATYPITVVKGSHNQALADAFIAYVVSPAGQSKLASFGFQHA